MIHQEEALQAKALGLALKVLRYVTKHTQVFNDKLTDHIVKNISGSLGQSLILWRKLSHAISKNPYQGPELINRLDLWQKITDLTQVKANLNEKL